MNRRCQHLAPPNKTVHVPSGLPWLFTDKAVTAWGGLRLMQEFLTRLHFREMLTASPLPHPLSNRGYSPVLMVESFLVAVWVGGVHFAQTALVRFDAALCEMFGWSQVASVGHLHALFPAVSPEHQSGGLGALGALVVAARPLHYAHPGP